MTLAHARNFARRAVGGSVRAFTLLEILVVIVVILILIIIAIPAFNSIIRTQEETTADAVVGAGVGLARDLARSSTGQGDVAAVFAYEPGGRTSIVICQRVGRLDVDQSPNANGGGNITRDVFVPVEGYETLQLPGGWSVRGYALAEMVDRDWYEPPNGGAERYPDDAGAWVFPETGFFDNTKQEDAGNRQTFMIRFEAGTGRALPSGGKGALVVLQRASTAERDNVADADDAKAVWKRIDRAADLRRWALRVLSAPRDGPDAANVLRPEDKRELIGDISGDTVLAKNVTSIAVYNERRLADALGLRVNSITESLYDADADDQNDGGRYQPQLINGMNDTARRNVNRWIEGWRAGTAETDTSFGSRADTQEARVYYIPPLVGALQPIVLPSRESLNVGAN